MTRPYAEIIGDPVAQSKSPLIHGFWLDALGIDAEYRRTHVTAEGLADYFVSRRGDPAWRGCNITMPHKLMALDHVDDPGDVRHSIGAINTAFRGEAEDGTRAVIGTNTDAAGFFAPIADLGLLGERVTVVGAGGAARAVLFALSRLGVGEVVMMGRSALKAAGLLSSFGLKGRTLPLDAALPPSRLLVNASTLGMAGAEPLTLDLSPLPPEAVVYDVVYTPLETPLLAAARGRGLETVDGLEMLVAQAATAFELFFGAAPPEGRDDELRALLLAA